MAVTKINFKKLRKQFEKDLSFEQLLLYKSKYKDLTNQIKNLNFENGEFFQKKEYYFPYTLESALLIVQNCTMYTSSKKLLLTHHFKDELNLHASSLTLIDANQNYL